MQLAKYSTESAVGEGVQRLAHRGGPRVAEDPHAATAEAYKLRCGFTRLVF